MVFISSKKELRKSVLRLKVNTRPLFKLRDLFFMHIKQSGQRWLQRLVQQLSNLRARAQIFFNPVLFFFSQPMDGWLCSRQHICPKGRKEGNKGSANPVSPFVKRRKCFPRQLAGGCFYFTVLKYVLWQRQARRMMICACDKNSIALIKIIF